MPCAVFLFRKAQTSVQMLFLYYSWFKSYQFTYLIWQHGQFYTVVLTDILQHDQHVEEPFVTSHERSQRTAFNIEYLSHNLLFLECSSFSCNMAHSASEPR